MKLKKFIENVSMNEVVGVYANHSFAGDFSPAMIPNNFRNWDVIFIGTGFYRNGSEDLPKINVWIEKGK